MQYLAYAQTAFTIWMLVDAYRRGAEGYWFYVILFLPGLGSWAYFLAVKAQDFRGLGGWSWPRRGPSPDELRYRAEQTPTLANNLALAECLVQRGEHGDAVPPLEAALVSEPGHGRVLYLLATCHVREGRDAAAIPLLEKILGRDRYWSNYAAWYLLIEAKGGAGDAEGVIASCRELARVSPTLRHQCLLAEHLIGQGQPAKAGEVLEKALQEYHYAPGDIRRRNRRWAGEAKRLLKRAQA